MGTYKDLLDMLEISHITFIIILIILFLITSFIVMLWKLGLLIKIEFKHMTFPKSNIIYTKYKGRYETINTKVQEVLEDTKGYFTLSDLFGIYYDPKDISHHENM
jgi:hypothetical protein